MDYYSKKKVLPYLCQIKIMKNSAYTGREGGRLDSMNEQLQYLGGIIQQRSSVLSAKLLDLPKGRPAFRFHYSQSGYTERMQAEMFTMTGHYLSSGDEQVKLDLLTLINLYGRKSKNRIASLNQIMEFVYLSRSVIMDLFEEELLEGRITADAIFQAMKVIDPLCLLISTEILHQYSDNLSTAKYELDESNKDLTMTLRELNDLKNALNEATIFSITDQDDRILSVNDLFCNASQYSREELIGQPHCVLGSGHHPNRFSGKSQIRSKQESSGEEKFLTGQRMAAATGSTVSLSLFPMRKERHTSISPFSMISLKQSTRRKCFEKWRSYR